MLATCPKRTKEGVMLARPLISDGVRLIAQVVLFLLAGLTLSAAEHPPVPTLHIPHVSRVPKITDFLNGTPREAEEVVTDFRQFDPGDGAPASLPTTAYLSYDNKNIYIAFICKDDPLLVRAHKAKRDNLLDDDRITISLDTFHDHRRVFWFDANFYGIQMDGINTDGVDDLSFDAVWYAEGRRLPDGYIVFATIPFRSLRFPNTAQQTWGIIIGRFIQRYNEFDTWPYVTHRRDPSWAGQGGDLQGISHIAPARNIQFIPYGLFSTSRFLDSPPGGIPQILQQNDARLGFDAKVVLRNAFTLDAAVNPDFSQVESDDPQVTVNQRFEVYFPEKRPLFTENAQFFTTPENLFFSRRIADPQFGVRLTGKKGRWAMGVIATDDRAPGEGLSPTDPNFGRRANAGVVRLQREFGSESYLGVLVSDLGFAGSSNRVYSVDSRVKIKPAWFVEAQAIGSNTRQLDGERLSGPAYIAGLLHDGRNFILHSVYTDRSPSFRSELGYIPRVDIRQLQNQLGYRWRPERRDIVSFGPTLTSLVNWDRKGRLQDWQTQPAFVVELPRLTTFGFDRFDAFELFQNLGFRKFQNHGYLDTQWLKWLAISSGYSWGTGVNYYPATGLKPFLAESSVGSLGFTFRPAPRIRFDQTYLYSRLATRGGDVPDGFSGQPVIFNNHVLRSKVNYQFTRELSLRLILDYNAVLPNSSLVALSQSKRFAPDILFTYLLQPGTAVYVGYTDAYENSRLNPVLPPYLQPTSWPGISVGREFFVKISYLFRM